MVIIQNIHIKLYFVLAQPCEESTDFELVPGVGCLSFETGILAPYPTDGNFTGICPDRSLLFSPVTMVQLKNLLHYSSWRLEFSTIQLSTFEPNVTFCVLFMNRVVQKIANKPLNI